MIRSATQRLLGRHVERRSLHTAIATPANLRLDARQAEIKDLHLALGRDHHVLGLEISVHQVERSAALAHRSPALRQTVRNLTANLYSRLGGDAVPMLIENVEHLAQRDPVHDLHHDRCIVV